MKLYDKTKIDKNNLLFTNRDLRILLIPVVVEQLLNSFMGMADTMMVSKVGSAAISAVSLVNSINVLVIQLFSAMAAGATIICAQYIGKKDDRNSNRAAEQVVLTTLFISVLIMLFCILFRGILLRAIFGQVEENVMQASNLYFLITACSFPFIALFNDGAAFYRAGGESRFPMKVSVISNVINIVGNALLIFAFHLGVAGAALSTLFSRIFSAVVIFYFLRKPKQVIVVKRYIRIKPDFALIRKILRLGIPSGIENGMFQFGKLAIQSSVSTLGTAAIAAQAMTIIFENLNGIAAIGIGIGLMTVVGQCIGAGRREEAKYYIVKLTGYAWIAVIFSCIFAFLLCRPVTVLAGMEAESAGLCIEMMAAITLVKPFVWVFSFIPGYGMRAAGDVGFSMLVSSLTMWFCRVALCTYLIRFCGFGPMAVWIGMFADWTLRGAIFSARYLSGRWMKFVV